MTGAERGFALLCCHLGDPERRPLTVAQFRKLSRRVRLAEKSPDDRELEVQDLTALGYGTVEAERILSLFAGEELLDRYLKKAEKFGCVPLTPLSPGYPRRLWEALGDEAPACLWARGDLSLLEKPGIALVGSRDLLPQNEAFARQAGREAARQGLTLISGNARGADRAAQRALSRNRCIHALGHAAIAAQCSLRMGGTWDGSVKNLRFGWSPLYVFDDGRESAELLEQMGAVKIGFEDLHDLRSLPQPSQLTL